MRKIIEVWLSRDIDSTEKNEGTYHISHKKLKLIKDEPVNIAGTTLDCFYYFGGAERYFVGCELIEKIFKIKLESGKQMKLELRG